MSYIKELPEVRSEMYLGNWLYYVYDFYFSTQSY